jgi:hypothetical protein
MPSLIGQVDADGAIVDMQFAWGAAGAMQLRSRLSPIPQPVAAKALIDTGAEMTCLDASLVRALRLPWRGPTPANIPALGGLTFQSQHDASLTVPHPSGNPSDALLVSDLVVLDVSLAALGYQALIGRDVVKRCRFFYDGPGDRFELSY